MGTGFGARLKVSDEATGAFSHFFPCGVFNQIMMSVTVQVGHKLTASFAMYEGKSESVPNPMSPTDVASTPLEWVLVLHAF